MRKTLRRIYLGFRGPGGACDLTEIRCTEAVNGTNACANETGAAAETWPRL
jgi:hypothetical protein